MARILYFAQLRERAGTPGEEIAVPADVRTGRNLLAWLGAQKPDLADILQSGRVRLALDQELASLDAPIGAAKEIALFPPMTGG